jgi:iron complex outermembrane receptor protein
MIENIDRHDACISTPLRACAGTLRSLGTSAKLARIAIPLALALLHAPPTIAADPLDISLEELLATEVTGASRKSQQLRDVAAAVFVLNREDIARSGATSIPDVLRLVPGVQVAQLGNGRWAVSARGFSGRFSNKLQVLMDGRSLYSPLFAGVLWETEDALLEDIERIEVIRGPGAAMWGANAVNGVINIVTRKARDTTGDLVTGTVGSNITEIGVRHGAGAGDGHYRLWAKALSQPDSPAAGSGDANDDRRAARAGFRGDWLFASGRQMTVVGGAFSNSMADRYLIADVASPVGVTPTDKQQRNRGANALARYQSPLPDGSRLAVQAYLDDSRMQITDFIDETRTTAELEFEHHIRFGDRHAVVWGAGHRYSRDRVESRSILSVAPERQSSRLTSLFIHDDITVIPDRFNVALGARFDRGETTGVETQPSIRGIWKPSTNQSAWISASRASRLPSRAERDVAIDLFVIPGAPTVLVRTIPSAQNLQPEVLDAVEAGYRSVLHDTASIDIAVFRNRYHDLRSGATGPSDVSGLPSLVVQNFVTSNALEARSHGIEISGDVQATPGWRLHPAFTWMRVKAWAANGDPTTAEDAKLLEGKTPLHQFSLRSSMNLGKKRQLDIVARYVARSERGNSVTPEVPSYTAIDARYAFRLSDGWELAVVGRNLGPRRHAESTSDLLPAQATEVERSALVTAKWEF